MNNINSNMLLYQGKIITVSTNKDDLEQKINYCVSKENLNKDEFEIVPFKDEDLSFFNDRTNWYYE